MSSSATAAGIDAAGVGAAPSLGARVASNVFTMATVWRLVRQLVFYGGLLAVWQLLYSLEIWSPYLFPSPHDVWSSLRANIENGLIWDSTKASLERLVVGFVLAFVVGMVMGVACGTMRWVDETLGSVIVGMQSLPSIAWLPLAVLWFGLSPKAITFVVLMGSVWAIAISARDGVRNIPVLQRRAAQVFGASRLQTVAYVTLPGMLPSMAQGLKLGWSFSWRSLMAAELIYSAVGLGHLLQVGRDLNDMPQVVSVMAVIVAVGLVFDKLVFGPVEWWVRQRWGLAGA